MPEQIRKLNFLISRTIKDIPEIEWNRLFGEDLIEGYGYQKTLEESRLKEFSFGYLIGSHEEKPVIILPFFIMDFSFHTLTRGMIQKLMLKLKKFLSMKVLFFGSPTAEEFYLGIDRSADPEDALEQALKAILTFCKKERVSGIVFNNVSRKDPLLSGYLAKRKFTFMESLPTTGIEINADSLDGYISGLSQNMRSDLKRKIKRSNSLASLTTIERDNIDDISGEIFSLYMSNFDNAGVHFEMLTQDFFKNICRNMNGVAKFFITYDKEKIVAFNLCLIKSDTFIDKFIGFDQSVAHKYHLYFTTFCHNIDYCIKNGLRFYQPGTTDYHPKVRLGAKLIPLDIWTKAPNRLLDLALKLAAPFIQPKNLDPSLKEIQRLKKKTTIS
jgi:hypothetical protein